MPKYNNYFKVMLFIFLGNAILSIFAEANADLVEEPNDFNNSTNLTIDDNSSVTKYLRASVSAATVAPSVKPARKPNILFAITDDSPAVFYPHTNAAHPMSNTNLYKEYYKFALKSSIWLGRTKVAVCGPGRGAILTGRNPEATGVRTFEDYIQEAGNGNITTLPKYLKQLGYVVKVIYKVYHPCDEERNTQIEYREGDLSYPITFTASYNGVCGKHAYCTKPAAQLIDTKISTAAKEFIAKMALTPDQPWALFIGFKNPHLDTEVSNAVLKSMRTDFVSYATPKIPGAIDWHHSLAYREYDGSKNTYLNFKGAWQPLIYGARKSVADLFQPQYAGTVNAARRAFNAGVVSDLQLFGSILNTLEEYDPNDQTAVFFTGDHGWKTGERGEYGKNGQGRRETEVNLLIRAPKQQKQSIHVHPTETRNIYCTIVDMVEGPQALKNFKDPSGLPLDCKSLLPILTDDEGDVDNGTLTEYYRCDPLNSIQSDDCMTGPQGKTCKNSSGRPKIKFIGQLYNVFDPVANGTWRYNAWFNFVNVYKGCAPAVWDNMPAGITSYGPYAWRTDHAKSGTDLTKPSMQQELYFYPRGLKIGDPAYDTVDNLAYNPSAASLKKMKEFDAIIVARLAKMQADKNKLVAG